MVLLPTRPMAIPAIEPDDIVEDEEMEDCALWIWTAVGVLVEETAVRELDCLILVFVKAALETEGVCTVARATFNVLCSRVSCCLNLGMRRLTVADLVVVTSVDGDTVTVATELIWRC